MPEFSPDQTRRWEAWRSANAISARHSERVFREAGLALISVALIALAVMLGR